MSARESTHVPATAPILISTPLPAKPPRHVRSDLWLYFVALLLALHVALYIIPPVRPGPLGWLGWVIGSDPSLWIVVAAGTLVIAIVWAVWKRPLVNRWRVIG